MIKISHLLKIVDVYRSAKRLTDASVGSYVFNDGKYIKRLRNGKEITVGRFNYALSWFSKNWPEGVPWPEDIPRPPVSEAQGGDVKQRKRKEKVMNENFVELKKLFDAEVERVAVKTSKIPAHLGGGERLAKAIVFINLLDGCSYEEARKIFRSLGAAFDEISRETFKVRASEVEDAFFNKRERLRMH